MFLIYPISERKFVVLSLRSTFGKPRQYFVQFNGYRFLCNCPHFLKNFEDPNFVCKHIVAVLKAYGESVSLLTTTTNKNNGKIPAHQMEVV